MGNITAHRAARADDSLDCAPADEGLGTWRSISRRRFIRYGVAASAFAATSLGRLVSYIPSAEAVQPGQCANYRTVLCNTACAGACAVHVSKCNYYIGEPLGTAECICEDPDGCGSFYVSASCTLSGVHVCCFAC